MNHQRTETPIILSQKDIEEYQVIHEKEEASMIQLEYHVQDNGAILHSKL